MVFGILVVLLCVEWIRSSRKAEREQKRRELEMETMREKKLEAQKRIEDLAEETNRLKAMKEQLEEQLVKEKKLPGPKKLGSFSWFSSS